MTAVRMLGQSVVATAAVMLPVVVCGRVILTKRHAAQRRPDSAAPRARSASSKLAAEAVVVVEAAYIASPKVVAIVRNIIARTAVMPERFASLRLRSCRRIAFFMISSRRYQCFQLSTRSHEFR